jgi:NDP-sugar pyrophosphorylase family protein
MKRASLSQISKAGIIAAGTGTRLRASAKTLKPLARVAGRPLIEWVLNSLRETGVSEVTIIINEESRAVREKVGATKWPFRIRWIVETTPSSMHSFLRVVDSLASDGSEGPFLISTVDTIALPGAFNRFLTDAIGIDDDVMITLAITPTRDDENPLLVDWDRAQRRVRGFGADSNSAQYATAGLYVVRSSIRKEGEQARRDGVHRLRSFLGRLLNRGYQIGVVPLAASIDVDRDADVYAAEEFIRQTPA